MYLISSVICVLLCGSITIMAGDRPKSYINLPLAQVYEASAKDITVEEFIDNSYQPVMITAALGRKTVLDLYPWSFARLHASLEAATTFCAVATGGRREKLKETEGEEQKEKEATGHGEKKLKENRGKDLKTNKGRERKGHEQIEEKGESKGIQQFKKPNQVTEESWDITEVSLRRFGLEGHEFSGEAFVNITKDFGKLIRLPEFLESFDFDAVMRAGLHYTRKGWLSQIDRKSRSFHSASVVCMLEGRVYFYMTPFPVQWEYIKCHEDTCTLRVDKSTPHGMLEQEFFVQAELGQRDCLFLPLEWIWQASAVVDSVALRIIWERDLTIRDDVLDDILSEGEMKHNSHEGSELSKDMDSYQTNREKNVRRPSRTIWEVLPQGLRRSSPVLWSNENPLLHLVRFYLLSSQRRNKTQFLHDFRVDRVILPNLVDCPPDCQTAASNIFILLDADSDGFLSEEDTLHLTQDTFDALSSELDDLMDELRDFGVEQWESVAKAGGDSNFMERAKDRMVESVKVAMRRRVAGDMDEQEEKNLKENNPSLYEDILAARKAKAHGDIVKGKEEL